MATSSRTFLAPEVIQTSSMDCGPASLKCVAQGYGVSVSYGRLREACQTSVDGTSIDTLEEIAVMLGFEAEQIICPADHVTADGADALPCIVVTVLPSGATHFVVAWRRVGDRVQIMDPGVGRRWVSAREFEQMLYIHEMSLPAEAWAAWSDTEELLEPLGRRYEQVAKRSFTRLAEEMLQDERGELAATVDAAVRLSQELVAAGGLRRGGEAARFIDRVIEGGLEAAAELIPVNYWTALPEPEREGDEPEVWIRGAVLVRFAGLRDVAGGDDEVEVVEEVVAALQESSSAPWRRLVELLTRAASGGTLFMLFLAAVLLALGGVVEAFLFRALIDLHETLELESQRAVAVVQVVSLLAGLLGLGLVHALVARWVGRSIEGRLRVEFRQALARLNARYFASRLRSDMAERAHALGSMRAAAGLVVSGWSAVVQLVVSVAVMCWLEPSIWPVVAVASAVLLVTPLIAQPALSERELRARVHAAAISQVVLDSLLGILPIRTHNAGESMGREHAARLSEWIRAQRAVIHAVSLVRGVESLVSLAAMLAIGWAFWLARPNLVGVLLLVYWAGELAGAARGFAGAVFSYPGVRNTLVRLDEILLAEQEGDQGEPVTRGPGGASVRARDAGVVVAGRSVLSGLELDIEPGEHVAIVGKSGAGKSTFIQALIGLNANLEGSLTIDGAPPRIEDAAEHIAWLDPSIYLWNASMMENILYGVDGQVDVVGLTRDAELRPLLAKLPSGLRTQLGESGRLLSGGEGQRVRMARALARADARLVLLDEPLRGLERDLRHVLLARMRERWCDATLICVTHDLQATRAFDRVLVIEDGQLVEDGAPTALLADESSRYAELIAADELVDERGWGDASWRHLTLVDGKIELTPRRELDEAAHAQGDGGADEERASSFADDELASWSARELHRGVSELIDSAPFGEVSEALAPAPGGAGALGDWFRAVGARCGVHFEPTSVKLGELDEVLRGGAPMVAQIERDGEVSYLLVCGATSRSLRVIAPGGVTREVSARVVNDAMVQGAFARPLAALSGLIEGAGARSARRARVERVMLESIAGARTLPTFWLLEPRVDEPLPAALGRVGVWRHFASLIVLGVVQYVLFTASWGLIGSGALTGEMQRGWMIAWVLVTLTMVPVSVLSARAAGSVGMWAMYVVKTRLLVGALRFDPREIRARGVGQLMGQLYESEVIGQLLLSGALGAVGAVIQLAMAGWVLSSGGHGASMVGALLVWCVVTAALSRALFVWLERWTKARVALSDDLVEKMLGHATRLVQQPARSRHDGEDELLATYIRGSAGLDRITAASSAVLERGWLVFAFLVFAPALVAAEAGSASVAVTLGGVLLAGGALASLGATLDDFGRAVIAWGAAREFFHAASGGDVDAPARAYEDVRGGGADDEPLLVGRGLSFAHERRARPVLDAADFELFRGERVLVQGSSGAGKSTLASILAGLRRPDAGLMMLGGIDSHTMSARAWRERVLLVPQFHENHIVSGTLGFNLLMGREWPCEPSVLEEAEVVCRELGLGALLDAMPGGMNQMVGETGWALSHGERNRVFIARALLQRADVVIFDESFSALDPESLGMVFECVLSRCPTMIVIAHP